MYMTRNSFISTLGAVVLVLAGTSCLQVDDISVPDPSQGKKKMGFDITVTRDGEEIPRESITKGATVDSDDNKIATMDKDIPFGLVGIDPQTESLILDNEAIFSDSEGYYGLFDMNLWDIPTKIMFSAYYPYVDNVSYSDNLDTYSIPFSSADTEAGPLVSKTVERAITQLNMLPLEFQHITNDIGYKIADVTPDPQLQGLIHLRKVTAYNIASAGIFINDVAMSQGLWRRQAYFRNVVVFEGDALVGVGEENEKFIGSDSLVDHMVDSHRYYAIPDEIKVGKQYVEVLYDVDGFDIAGFYYQPIKNLTAKYMLYGLLPDNVFVYGRQYTFHLGLDLTQIYKQVAFNASVSEWETKIYENNDTF